MADNRIDNLRHWVADKLSVDDIALTTVSGDASFRKYYRCCKSNQSYIVVDAPPDKENNPAFVQVAQALYVQNLNVPKLHAVDYEQGFLLLSDLGDKLYLNHLDESNADALYKDAIDALITIQQNQTLNINTIPHFDASFIKREIALFTDWFLAKLLQYEMTTSEYACFDSLRVRLIQIALEQPQVCVHRDYHSRNLMITETGNPGIIDFQDAVWGPISYDLVSLLRDSYIVWPKSFVNKWVQYYQQQALARGLLATVDDKLFQQWFDYVGLQRNLKILGIFARLSIRDGKSNYIKDIPRTLNYAMDVCARYEELAPFYQFLSNKVEIMLKKQVIS